MFPHRPTQWECQVLLGAEKIYLVAQGKHKKEILEEAVYGDVTDEIPASLLQEHPNCEVYYSE